MELHLRVCNRIVKCYGSLKLVLIFKLHDYVIFLCFQSLLFLFFYLLFLSFFLHSFFLFFSFFLCFCFLQNYSTFFHLATKDKSCKKNFVSAFLVAFSFLFYQQELMRTFRVRPIPMDYVDQWN